MNRGNTICSGHSRVTTLRKVTLGYFKVLSDLKMKAVVVQLSTNLVPKRKDMPVKMLLCWEGK